MKQITLILIVLCALLLVGCNEKSNSSNAQTQAQGNYNTSNAENNSHNTTISKALVDCRVLLSKSKNLQEYNAVYSVYERSGIVTEGIPEFSESMNISVFKKGNNEKKSTIGTSPYGVGILTQAYNISGKEIICIEPTNNNTPINSQTTGCVTDSYSTQNFLEKLSNYYRIKPFGTVMSDLDYSIYSTPQLNVFEGGTETVMGKTCRDFSIFDVNSSVYSVHSIYVNNSYATVMIQSPVRYDLCIDEETGIVLTLKVYMKKDSGSSGEYYNQTLFESNILSFTENVSDSEFIPPIPFAFKKAVCDNDKIYVTLDSYINYDGILIAKINNNGYSSYKSVLLGAPIENVSIQANMSTINTQRLEIKTFSPFNYSVNYFQLCVGDSCVGDEECDYDRCAKYNAYGDSSMDKCMTDTECMYKDDICQKVICYDLKSKDACLNSEICAWSSRKGAEHCESKMCLEFVSQESCEKDDQCVWYNNKCEISNCLYDHSNDLLFNKTDHDNSDMFYNNTDNRKMFCEFYLSCSWDSGNNICLSNSTYEKDVIDWRK